MILLALLAVLVEGPVSVPAARWRIIDVDVPQAGSAVVCTFRTREPSLRIAAHLLTDADAQRFLRGQAPRAVASTGFEHEATLRHVAEQPGRFLLLLDNRLEGRSDAPVYLRVELLRPLKAEARTLPPERRLQVVLASVLFFLSVVAFAGWKLMR